MRIVKSREEIGELVIQEMRKHPGCEKLERIRIVGDADEWSVAPTDRAAQFSEVAQRAASGVILALRKKYAVSSRCDERRTEGR